MHVVHYSWLRGYDSNHLKKPTNPFAEIRCAPSNNKPYWLSWMNPACTKQSTTSGYNLGGTSCRLGVPSKLSLHLHISTDMTFTTPENLQSCFLHASPSDFFKFENTKAWLLPMSCKGKLTSSGKVTSMFFFLFSVIKPDNYTIREWLVRLGP